MKTPWAKEIITKQSKRFFLPHQLVLKFSNPVFLKFSLILSDYVRYPTFAHVAVIRKKDERRKLKGTTCKECEVVSVSVKEAKKLIILRSFCKTLVFPNSITLISRRRRKRRSCLHVPGTDFCTFLPALLKTSGKLDSRQRRHASKEVILPFFCIEPLNISLLCLAHYNITESWNIHIKRS